MLGVVVFAHGSRDPLWRAPVEAVAQRIAQQDASVRVACAYLELCEPDLMGAVASLRQQGVQRVRVLPLFFGMGKHAREDLPTLMQQLSLSHPDMAFDCLPPAGESEPLRDLLAHMALQR